MKKTKSIEELRFSQKLLYGAGEVTTTISGTIIGFLYVYFLTNVMGLAPALAGLVFLVGSIWDAVSDPIVGYISDITRSKFGRRRVYFLFTAVPFSLAFFLIWTVPAGWSQWGMFAYATLSYMIYRTVSTLFIIPYTAYGMEIVKSYDGRTSLQSYRFFFSILFGLVAAAVPEMITKMSIDPAIPEGMPSIAGYMLMAGIFAIPLFIGPIFAFFAYKEEPYNNAPRSKFLKQFLSAFKNKSFLNGLGMYLASWIAIGFIQGMLVYYIGAIGQTDNFSLIAAIIMGTAVVCLPIWVIISKKLDKRKAYILGMLICGVTLSALMLPTDIVNNIIWILLPIIGFGMSSMHMIPHAIMPEAIEAGQVKDSKGEGVYYGIVTFCEKIGVAVIMQFSTIVMQLFGYISTEQGQVVTQPDAALTCIRIMMGVIPVLLIIVGIIFARKFKVGREESRLLHIVKTES